MIFVCFDNCLAEGSPTMIVLKQMLKDLCIPLAAHKTVWDPQLSEYLGITLILIKMEARLPAEKINRIIQIMGTMCTKSTVTK